MSQLEEIQAQLEEIKEILTTSKKVLNLNEVADYIGYSKSHIYKLTSTKEIPHSKPNGKGLFFDKDEIDCWLLNNKVPTNEVLKRVSRGEASIDDPSTWGTVNPDWMTKTPNYWGDNKSE
jgi:excisionase family DNA binding protein|tara:strand:- start:1353 stop:1712 length:360 start_codon:yes stop_codon:yes gene_type:complete